MCGNEPRALERNHRGWRVCLSGVMSTPYSGVAQNQAGGANRRFWSMFPLARVPFGTGFASLSHSIPAWLSLPWKSAPHLPEKNSSGLAASKRPSRPLRRVAESVVSGLGGGHLNIHRFIYIYIYTYLHIYIYTCLLVYKFACIHIIYVLAYMCGTHGSWSSFSV